MLYSNGATRELNLFMLDNSKMNYHKSLKQGFHKYHLLDVLSHNRHL